MNKRIRLLAELADKAIRETDLREVNGGIHITPAFEKFAELIIRECVEQLRYTVLDTQELRRDKSTDYQVGWEDGMFDAEEMIKQHFRS